MHDWLVLSIFLAALSHASAYDLIREYAGSSFFEGWNFYGDLDNLTWGNVTWVTQEVATSQDLAYVDSNGHAIIKVDNATNVQMGQLRNSVRITTQDAYGLGSIWVIDLNHIPYGCSVWPAFWSLGPTWPNDGEIDIIEGINLNTNNQMSIHSTEGCYHSGNTGQLGTTGSTDCSRGSGCTVEETSPNSFYTSFAEAGGGVYATQFDASGIFMWFWSRPDIPSSISQTNSASSINISAWGTPHAAFSSNTCNISEFFSSQNLVLDIDLCGDWAGVPSIYGSQCSNEGSTGICYNDCVVGPGSPRYDDAYFDINYIRTYATSAVPGSNGTVSQTTVSPSASVSLRPAGPAKGAALRVNLMMSLASLVLPFIGAVFLMWSV